MCSDTYACFIAVCNCSCNDVCYIRRKQRRRWFSLHDLQWGEYVWITLKWMMVYGSWMWIQRKKDMNMYILMISFICSKLLFAFIICLDLAVSRWNVGTFSNMNERCLLLSVIAVFVVFELLWCVRTLFCWNVNDIAFWADHPFKLCPNLWIMQLDLIDFT